MPCHPGIESARGRGATIVTGSARAARRLHFDFARRQAAQGRQAWSTPAILDWQSWLHQLWQDWSFAHPDAPVLLTPLQERALWQQVQHSDANLVVSPESMAALAQSAYALLSAYDAHASREQFWPEIDAELFRQWAQRFDRACERHAWLSPALLESQLAEAVQSEALALPREIVLVGFDRTTPSQDSLLQALRLQNVTVNVLNAEVPAAELRFVQPVGVREEIEACAFGIRELLAARPEATPGGPEWKPIAVLSTEVDRQRGQIDRIFRSILTPECISVFSSQDPRATYEFSLGEPLGSIPVIHAALLALRWVVRPLPQQDATWLLLSGFLFDARTDELALAQADARLREKAALSPLVSLPRVLSALHAASDGLGTLRGRLQHALDFAAVHRFSSEDRSPSAWAELVRLLLDEFGWSGAAALDSIQYQARQRWDKLLEDVALLDLHSERISYARFLHQLATYAEETLFSAESLAAPVQIMGPLEAAGQEFDAIWFLGVSDQQWPSTGTPHPLLPLHVQRQAGMPHATKDEDWQLAQTVTRRILASAREITFSCAQRDKDGELRPSPLLSLFDLESVSLATLTTEVPALEPEYVHDAAQVGWSGGESSGGAGLLRDQAACPFRAFAAHRLHARALDEAEWGLSAIERGNLLHDVMHRFWTEESPRRISGLDDLRRTIAEDQLLSVLRYHIQQAFADWTAGHTEEPWTLAYLRSEQQRLATRLHEWLQDEAKRQPFLVEACEQTLSNVQVGNLHLRLRADRIDRLPDGDRLLIDYKTGAVHTSAWHGDRPDEPQLPLYAAYGNVENVGGVLFAQIRAGHTAFLGHVREAKLQLYEELKNASPFVKFPYQDSMRDGWAEALAALAEEFSRGDAAVRPKHGRRTCEHCAITPLCRIHELPSRSEGDPEHA
jgi:ATP-dependent helicase/nuclease subunit B